MCFVRHRRCQRCQLSGPLIVTTDVQSLQNTWQLQKKNMHWHWAAWTFFKSSWVNLGCFGTTWGVPILTGNVLDPDWSSILAPLDEIPWSAATSFKIELVTLLRDLMDLPSTMSATLDWKVTLLQMCFFPGPTTERHLLQFRPLLLMISLYIYIYIIDYDNDKAIEYAIGKVYSVIFTKSSS